MHIKNKRLAPEVNKLFSLKKAAAMFILLLVFQLSLTSGVFAETGSEEQIIIDNQDIIDEQDTIDEQDIIDEQLKSGNIEKIENQLEEFSDQEIEKIIPQYDPEKILEEAAKGKLDFSISGVMGRIAEYLFKELYQNIGILIKLVILVILCSLLKNLQASFLNESVGELAFYTCYVVVVSIMFVSFNTVLNMATDIIDKMVAFMHATVPVLITLLVSGGNITSAGIFQPVLIMVIEMAATIIRNIFLPLVLMSTILSIVDNISEKIQISRFAALLKQVTIWCLGFMLTVFVAVITLQGTVGAVVDGITSKTAKFAIGAFIPVAGKYLADAAEAVMGCTLLIKNSAGVVALIGIVAICVVPLLKILAIVVLYRLTCVLIEPIAEKRITNCINDIAGSLTFILGIVASVAVMFLIAITAIIGASNISTMIR